MPEPCAAAGGGAFPAWVLLETTARIGRRANATTARTLTSAGAAIEVSFELADPPTLSHCFVYSPDLTAPPPPRVTGADGAFVLIHATFPRRDGQRLLFDVFVYKAGSGDGGGPGAPPPPSLRLLPRPYPIGLLFNHVGVLSPCAGDGHCLVVLPHRRFDAARRYGRDLHIFSTKSGAWSTKATGDMSWFPHDHTKVFSVGGGALAWVDLRHGILLCNVLGDEEHNEHEHHPTMCRIRLPPLLPSNAADLGRGLDDGAEPPLDQIRDVIFRDGWFRLVEAELPDLDDDDLTRLRWTATVFRSRITAAENWELCHAIDSADLSPGGACATGDLVPEMWDGEEKKLTWDTVITLSPTLDTYGDDDALYMMAKLDVDCPDGWVLAVDAGNKKLDKVAPFSTRVSFSRTYMQCAFSSTSTMLRPP